jgi:hypothetical protein
MATAGFKTISAFGNAAGMDREQMSNLLNGKRSHISPDDLDGIMGALNLDLQKRMELVRLGGWEWSDLQLRAQRGDLEAKSRLSNRLDSHRKRGWYEPLLKATHGSERVDQIRTEQLKELDAVLKDAKSIWRTMADRICPIQDERDYEILMAAWDKLSPRGKQFFKSMCERGWWQQFVVQKQDPSDD